MPWHEKPQPTPFDDLPIHGLMFLNGDVLAKRHQQEWLKGKKYPMVSFPSGLSRELWDSSTPGGIVHIFGELELLRQSSRDEAYNSALAFAQLQGYFVTKHGDNQLEIFSPQSR
jgi:hypothetical protein